MSKLVQQQRLSNENENEKTRGCKTIRVSDETHESLTKIGLKNETYDHIIKQLILSKREVTH